MKYVVVVTSIFYHSTFQLNSRFLLVERNMFMFTEVYNYLIMRNSQFVFFCPSSRAPLLVPRIFYSAAAVNEAKSRAPVAVKLSLLSFTDCLLPHYSSVRTDSFFSCQVVSNFIRKKMRLFESTYCHCITCWKIFCFLLRSSGHGNILLFLHVIWKSLIY